MLLSVATPPLRLPLPSETAPSRNVTVPLAVVGTTLTVSTTVWVVVEGLAEEVRVSVAFARLTVSLTAAEVLAALALEPP